ncbi:hypothetical protein BDZ94DRAFT_1271986 [Collybia nuda]|uniref:Uncharacterized protein n=1 Tax=Collybia nuda TaxID=64659 RepID=A0A9P6CDA7_9AGAR|nr:hypothetical protein BDZ94DRAFT_1271986 [Collybia nuda]
MSRSLHFAPLTMISLAGAALAATRVARQDPSQPSLTPVLFFNSLEQVIACQSTNIRWVYDGPNDAMAITVSNEGVDQVDPPPPPSQTVSNTLSDNALTRRAVPTGVFQLAKTIATVLPRDASFNWAQVNVPQGWYRLLASIPSSDYATFSADFYVAEVGDTSCLNTLPPPSSPPSSPSPTPPTTGSPTPPPPSPSPSPSQTVIPVSGASSSVNKGAIAGGVIGGVVLLLVVLGIYLCLLRSKRHSNQPHSPRSRGPPSLVSSKRGSRHVGGWGGLSSVDSNLNPSGRKSKPQPKPYANARHQSQTDSLGPIIPGGGAASEEDIRSYRVGGPFSPSEEKVGFGETGVGVLPYTQNTRPGVMGRSYSASTVGSTNEYAMGRRPSVNSANALPPGARRPSIEYPPYAVSPSPQLDRAPSNASSPSSQLQAQPRKTPRKPVPAYSPGSISPSSSNPSPITSSPTTPVLVSPFDDERAQRRMSGGHYATRARDGSRDRGGKDGRDRRDRGGNSGNSSTEDGPALAHKSSFGPGGVEGKPLHYLIPDMPPPSVGQ